jgi:acetyl-CoA carboxylase carboxyltransferase component
MIKKPFEDSLNELQQRRNSALQMGGEKKLEKRRDEGHLNARERIGYLMARSQVLVRSRIGGLELLPTTSPSWEPPAP